SAQFVNELGNERFHNCFRELELVTVKGRAEPIQLWGLADVR
ncbi:MAG: hypothetical protein RJB13_2519, partial [Pseudomonadota bacterium]